MAQRQRVCLPIQERPILSLGQKETTTHSSILAGEIPRTEESGRLRTMGLQRVGQDLTVELTV